MSYEKPMTVQELIDQLMEIEDKTKPVVIPCGDSPNNLHVDEVIEYPTYITIVERN